mmetsp:Transcript_63425/g.169401  ORF Transcript_63425/g.169401 Transcript_63425/m.169401 type:complete len:277 (+) Transcript_63425:816-1646(+)
MRRKLRSKIHCSKWFMPDFLSFSKFTCSASYAAAKASLSATFIAITSASGIAVTPLLTSTARRAPSARRSKTKGEACTGTGTAFVASGLPSLAAVPGEASPSPFCENFALPQPHTWGTSSSERRQNDPSGAQLSPGTTARRAQTQYAWLLYRRTLPSIACACEARPGSPEDTAEARRPCRCDGAESPAGLASATAESSASKAVAARAALRCIEISEGGFDAVAEPSCGFPSLPLPTGQSGATEGSQTFSHILAKLSLTAPSSAAMIGMGTTPPCLT